MFMWAVKKHCYFCRCSTTMFVDVQKLCLSMCKIELRQCVKLKFADFQTRVLSMCVNYVCQYFKVILKDVFDDVLCMFTSYLTTVCCLVSFYVCLRLSLRIVKPMFRTRQLLMFIWPFGPRHHNGSDWACLPVSAAPHFINICSTQIRKVPKLRTQK
jgi:hypothetical protein